MKESCVEDLIDAVGVDAVREATELEDHPRLVDLRSESWSATWLGLAAVDRPAVRAGDDVTDVVFVRSLACPIA